MVPEDGFKESPSMTSADMCGYEKQN